jgi:adenylylsulfate kinase-like enzyme
MRAPSIPAIVVTGPVGAGKTTTGRLVQEMLAGRGKACAFVDQDALRMVLPTPPGDRFGSRLGYRNLAAVWPNLRDAGVQIVVIADVVEDAETSRGDYLAALPDTTLTIVRLDVPMPLIRERLQVRERTPGDLAWSVARAPELQDIMENAGIGDLVIDVGTRTPEQIAAEIIERTGILSRE